MLKKLLSAVALIAAVTFLPSVRATVLLSDSFTYPDGPITSNSGGTWVTHSGTAGQAAVLAGVLNLSEGQSEDISATLTGAPIAKDSGAVLYAGFKVKFSALPSGAGTYFAHFKDTGTSNFRGRIFASTTGAAAGSLRLGISSASATPTLLETDLAIGTTYQVVLKLDVNTAVATLWVNPAAESDPSVVSADTGAALAISTFAFRESLSGGNGMGTMTVDDLTVATSFDEVLGQTADGPVVIVTQPSNQTNVVGQNVVFSVNATGTAPLAYQWQVNRTNIPGATGAFLALNNITKADAGPYRVSVTNSINAVLSDEATLTVNDVPPPSGVITNIAYLHTLEDVVNYQPTDTTTLFQVDGVVTTYVNMTSGTANASFYIQDDTGGVAVFYAGGFANLPPVGAKVRVVAPLSAFNGLLELSPSSTKPATSVTVLSTDNPQPTPVSLDFNWQNDIPTIESHEGQLVVAENVTIDQTSTAGVFASGKNITMTSQDGSTTFALFVNAGTDLVGQTIPSGPVTVIGVLGQFDSSDPRTAGYELIPSRYLDVQSNLKPPRIAFTNVLANLVRPGDAPTNSFTDFGLRPGEKITVAVSITDPSSKPFTVSTSGGTLPTGGAWVLSGTTAGAGETVTGTFTYTAVAADAGQNFPVTLVAENDSAPATLVINIYVPTAAEQRVLISEFYANPTATASAPNYNPLNRETLLPGTTDLSPSNRDEFVELVNLSDETVDLSGWVVTDSLLRRAYVYPGTPAAALISSNAVIIYGGPATGYLPQLPVGSIPAEVGPTDPASTAGLALNDTGDTIIVRNVSSNVIARVVYTAAMVSANSSLTRFPNTEGDFVAHFTASGGYASPGLQPNGQLWSVPQVTPVTSIATTAALTSGGLTLTWNSVAGATYSVSSSADAAGTYSPVQTGITSGTFTVPATAAAGFYKITSP
ncbi:MAG TPA: lamin tail domain-containing protein [Candidatus Limnocylindria bacterium]|jgi:hypothetical protein|nr:lamin tail domain-containing protein [Candidatus Limnocylindria bacterium]